MCIIPSPIGYAGRNEMSDRKDAEVIIYELVFTKEKYAETMRSVIESYLERQAYRHNEQIQP